MESRKSLLVGLLAVLLALSWPLSVMADGPAPANHFSAAPADQTDSNTTIYIVTQGDTLPRLAWKFNTTVSRLYQLNPGLSEQRWLYAGQIIRVPGSPLTPFFQNPFDDPASFEKILASYNWQVWLPQGEAKEENDIWWRVFKDRKTNELFTLVGVVHSSVNPLTPTGKTIATFLGIPSHVILGLVLMGEVMVSSSNPAITFDLWLHAPISNMSMEHEESWRIVESLKKTFGRKLSPRGKGPKAGTLEFWGADKGTFLKVGIVWIKSLSQVNFYIVHCPLSTTNKGADWTRLPQCDKWYGPAEWNSAWTMSRYTGRGVNPSNMWLSAGQGWLKWQATKAAEGMDIPLGQIVLP